MWTAIVFLSVFALGQRTTSGKSAPLPLFPTKPTFANAIGMSVEGHKRICEAMYAK